MLDNPRSGKAGLFVDQEKTLRFILLAILGLYLLLFALSTYRWPMIGDATLMDYVVFLIKHGRAPYRDIIDMNMPATYLIQEIVVGIGGNGSLTWRCFDFAVVGLAIASMSVIAIPYDWLMGVFAGTLFAFVHGVDGIPNEGQRDLIVAALMMASYAAMFTSVRQRRKWLMVLFGGFMGTAAAIKPTFTPLLLVLPACAAISLKKKGESFASHLALSILGMLLPLTACALFIKHYHVWHGFLTTLTDLLPYDATLGRRPLSYFLQHCLSPIQPLVVASILIGILGQRSFNWEFISLFCGAFVSLGSYIVQGKGYPYHRYPFLATMLVLSCLVVRSGFKGRTTSRILAAFCLLFGILWLMPVSLAKIRRYEWWKDDFQASLSDDLSSLGGKALSGKVQCFDMSAGCIKTLDRMHLAQSTGFLYDYYLLDPKANSYVLRARSNFYQQIVLSPPSVIIVTSQDYLFGNQGFDKIHRWPQLEIFLKSHYFLYKEQKEFPSVRWEPRVSVPAGYQIFSLKSAASQLDLSKSAVGRNETTKPPVTKK